VVSDKLSPRCILAGDLRRKREQEEEEEEGRGTYAPRECRGTGTKKTEKRLDRGGNAIGDREKFAAREIRREKADMAVDNIE